MNDPNDVVRVAAGELVQVELYQQALKEAGIDSKVVGESLGASFGTAIPGAIELWVHRSDLENATKAIERMEAEREQPTKERHQHGRPTSE